MSNNEGGVTKATRTGCDAEYRVTTTGIPDSRYLGPSLYYYDLPGLAVVLGIEWETAGSDPAAGHSRIL